MSYEHMENVKLYGTTWNILNWKTAEIAYMHIDVKHKAMSQRSSQVTQNTVVNVKIGYSVVGTRVGSDDKDRKRSKMSKK